MCAVLTLIGVREHPPITCYTTAVDNLSPQSCGHCARGSIAMTWSHGSTMYAHTHCPIDPNCPNWPPAPSSVTCTCTCSGTCIGTYNNVSLYKGLHKDILVLDSSHYKGSGLHNIIYYYSNLSGYVECFLIEKLHCSLFTTANISDVGI